uniref:Cadherin domain-containing protein n=1 Tax=Strigamia maritima TaxID=126957 RepID=T1IH69_STRMM
MGSFYLELLVIVLQLVSFGHTHRYYHGSVSTDDISTGGDTTSFSSSGDVKFYTVSSDFYNFLIVAREGGSSVQPKITGNSDGTFKISLTTSKGTHELNKISKSQLELFAQLLSDSSSTITVVSQSGTNVKISVSDEDSEDSSTTYTTTTTTVATGLISRDVSQEVKYYTVSSEFYDFLTEARGGGSNVRPKIRTNSDGSYTITITTSKGTHKLEEISKNSVDLFAQLFSNPDFKITVDSKSGANVKIAVTEDDSDSSATVQLNSETIQLIKDFQSNANLKLTSVSEEDGVYTLTVSDEGKTRTVSGIPSKAARLIIYKAQNPSAEIHISELGGSGFPITSTTITKTTYTVRSKFIKVYNFLKKNPDSQVKVSQESDGSYTLIITFNGKTKTNPDLDFKVSPQSDGTYTIVLPKNADKTPTTSSIPEDFIPKLKEILDNPKITVKIEEPTTGHYQLIVNDGSDLTNGLTYDVQPTDDGFYDITVTLDSKKYVFKKLPHNFVEFFINFVNKPKETPHTITEHHYDHKDKDGKPHRKHTLTVGDSDDDDDEISLKIDDSSKHEPSKTIFPSKDKHHKPSEDDKHHKHHRPTSDEDDKHHKHHRPTSDEDDKHYKHHRPTSDEDDKHHKHHRPTSDEDDKHHKHHRPTSDEDDKHHKHHRPTSDEDDKHHKHYRPTSDEDDKHQKHHRPTSDEDEHHRHHRPTSDEDEHHRHHRPTSDEDEHHRHHRPTSDEDEHHRHHRPTSDEDEHHRHHRPTSDEDDDDDHRQHNHNTHEETIYRPKHDKPSTLDLLNTVKNAPNLKISVTPKKPGHYDIVVDDGVHATSYLDIPGDTEHPLKDLPSDAVETLVRLRTDDTLTFNLKPGKHGKIDLIVPRQHPKPVKTKLTPDILDLIDRVKKHPHQTFDIKPGKKPNTLTIVLKDRSKTKTYPDISIELVPILSQIYLTPTIDFEIKPSKGDSIEFIPSHPKPDAHHFEIPNRVFEIISSVKTNPSTTLKIKHTKHNDYTVTVSDDDDSKNYKNIKPNDVRLIVDFQANDDLPFSLKPTDLIIDSTTKRYVKEIRKHRFPDVTIEPDSDGEFTVTIEERTYRHVTPSLLELIITLVTRPDLDFRIEPEADGTLTVVVPKESPQTIEVKIPKDDEYKLVIPKRPSEPKFTNIPKNVIDFIVKEGKKIKEFKDIDRETIEFINILITYPDTKIETERDSDDIELIDDLRKKTGNSLTIQRKSDLTLLIGYGTKGLEFSHFEPAIVIEVLVGVLADPNFQYSSTIGSDGTYALIVRNFKREASFYSLTSSIKILGRQLTASSNALSLITKDSNKKLVLGISVDGGSSQELNFQEKIDASGYITIYVKLPAVEHDYDLTIYKVYTKKVSDISKSFGGIFESIFSWLGNLVSGIVTGVANVVSGVGKVASNVVGGAVSAVGNVVGSVGKAVGGLFSGLFG